MYLAPFFLTLFSACSAQILQQFTENLCASKSTCSECIRTPSCAWCYDKEINATKRCFQPSYQQPPLDQCREAYIYNPDNVVNIIRIDELTTTLAGRGGGGGFGGGFHANASESGSGHFGGGGASGGGSAEGSFTQIKPQRVSLRLRAKQTETIHMSYSRAEDYPLDLYYLMDLSKSMEDDKQKLSALGNHLAQTMKAMTSKFTLGFGSFVDKVVMPYVSTIPSKLRHPCTGCVAPYGFRNHMTLSTNTNTFSQMVSDASVSGNLDAPEGGFDAIMQAVVCRKEIGWREQARRLLVFSTDAGFHYAGDGKLGGIVQPNDAACHLDERGYYTMSSKQDYPSISQINTYVKKNSINVIFAVTADKIGIYKQLQSHIEGSTCGQLSNDSSNVVELIKEQYNAISSTVEMKHNASSDVSIKFFSRCLNEDGPVIETNKCNDIKVGNLIEFRLEIQILQCPEKREDWQQVIDIHPFGINESLIIDLTMLCDCPCEHGGYAYEERSPKCHNKGTLKCGICDCDQDAYGAHCECSSKNDTLTNVTTINCINKKTGLECSGKGSCICGKCECDSRANPNERIYGDQCECDNFSCERHNGQICSGPDHGVCDCGTCACKPGWTGTNCACRDAPQNCMSNRTGAANESLLCSGNGVCECGVCKCNMTDDGPYFGPFCEHNPNSTDDCRIYKPCVQCRLYGTGDYKTDKECLENPLCNFHIIEKDVIEVNESNSEILCAFYDENDCRYAFVYYYNETAQIEVRAQKELECPPIVFLMGIVLGVIGAVILMGLAILLLWKLLTTIHDRREFAKFQKEAMMARWDTGENPIYKQATSTFKNPTYAGKS